MADYDLIVWNDGLVTGIDKIDEQHQILINLFNEANTKLTANNNADFLEQITRDLLSYALYHFETEEELMQKYGYSEEKTGDIERHILQHRSFSAKVVAVHNDIKAGILISREDLLAFLNSWLINHILNTDKQLAAFLLASEKYRSENPT
ncbi:bacteriohemerythrin [Methylobacter sp. Wu8]|uniref:Hemerythrin n=1 Tax=Methylobacter tundripaludum TaxID=173365 RepID=A0A2S6H205_9GAMM|nr:bacteriohemerythrin [Methylobacter tundripaludum]MCF7964415.1 bacteriohemerythrin [Methylobacter tundripaludum]PPK71518.1 hemerythrin [Methylobacter tundripaludum]